MKTFKQEHLPDSSNILAMLGIVPYFLLFFTKRSLIEGLVTTIGVTVQGDYIVKTGVRHYSFYGSYQPSFTISCELNTPRQPIQVSIMSNANTIENRMQRATPHRFTTKWEATVTTDHFIHNGQYRYTCRASFSNLCPLAVNGSQCHSVIDSDVDVRLGLASSLLSNVGLIVYLGEEISISCIDTGYSSSYTRRCEWQTYYESSSTTNNIIVTAETGIDQCSWLVSRASGWYRVCYALVPELTILNNLTLSLLPSDFSSNVTTLHFSCTSVPPRLMRWTIITDKGDIVDLGTASDIITVNMNVTVKQRRGMSTLNVNEASAGGNGIISVTCSSYDTLAQVSASSHRVLIDECNDGDTVTAPSTVTVPSAVTVPYTVTVPSTTFTTKTTAIYKQGTQSAHTSAPITSENQSVTEENLAQACGNQRQYYKSSNRPTFIVLLITTLATVICILTVVVLILLRKLQLTVVRASSIASDAEVKVPSETVLHDNPVYQSYSETAGFSPEETELTDTCVYVNI